MITHKERGQNGFFVSLIPKMKEERKKSGLRMKITLKIRFDECKLCMCSYAPGENVIGHLFSLKSFIHYFLLSSKMNYVTKYICTADELSVDFIVFVSFFFACTQHCHCSLPKLVSTLLVCLPFFGSQLFVARFRCFSSSVLLFFVVFFFR